MKKTVDRDSPKTLNYEEFSAKLKEADIVKEILNGIKLKKAKEEEKQRSKEYKVTDFKFIPVSYDIDCSIGSHLNEDIEVISTEKYTEKMTSNFIGWKENPINIKPPKCHTVVPRELSFIPNLSETTTVVSGGEKEDSSYRGLCIRLLTSLKEEVGVIEIDGGEPLNKTKKVIKEAEQKLC